MLQRLELVLLQLINKGEGKWSWYELASHLSRLDVPREPDMMVVLKTLAAEGLIERYLQTGSPRDRWELTEAGKIQHFSSMRKYKTFLDSRMRENDSLDICTSQRKENAVRLGIVTQIRGSMASLL